MTQEFKPTIIYTRRGSVASATLMDTVRRVLGERFMDGRQLRDMDAVLSDVRTERYRQHDEHGEQDLPGAKSGDHGLHEIWARVWQRTNDALAEGRGTLTYYGLVREELEEAAAEQDLQRQYAEVIQVAAVASQWAESLRREMRRK